MVCNEMLRFGCSERECRVRENPVFINLLEHLFFFASKTVNNRGSGAQIPAEPILLSRSLWRFRTISETGCWLPMLSYAANRSNRFLLRLSWSLGLTGAILPRAYRL